MRDVVDRLEPVQFESQTSDSHTHDHLVKEPMSRRSQPLGLKLLLALVIVLAGVGTGYAANEFFGQPAVESKVVPTSAEAIVVGGVYGDKDTTKFADPAEGVLVIGGIEGEGSHHLMRPGGRARNVYLTSSVLDLSLFENCRINVYGETFASQKAGWLMDVGRVEVIELNAEKPFEETSTANQDPLSD